MATPGFNEDYYLAQKLESLQTQTATAADWADKDADDVKEAIEEAGFTPETHYEQIGFNEEIINADGSTTKLTPNEFFNAEEYIAAKANQLLELNADAFGPTVAAAKQSFIDALDGANPYDHYLQFGDAEGLNPSNAFDTEKYFEAKLAALQADEDSGFDGESTVADVKAAFAEAGLSAAVHYEVFGKDEGISVTAVDAADRVDLQAADIELTEDDDEITGTAGDDVIEGAVSALSSDNTLNAEDTIDGVAGSDTLRVELSTDFGGFTVSGDASAVTNVETLEIVNDTNQARSFDAEGIEGVDTIQVSQNDQDMTVSNITDSDNGPVFEVRDADGSTTLTLEAGTELAEDLASGDSDTLSLTTFGVGTAGTTPEALSVALGDVEELDLTVAGSSESFIDVSGMTSLETLNVDGSADFTLTDAPSTLETIDAGDASGNMTLDATSGSVESVTTGAGDDEITADESVVTASFDGGAGDDTLKLNTTTAATVQFTTSSLETLDITDIGGTLTFSGKNVSDVNTITASSDLSSGADLVKMGAADLTFDLDGSADGAITADHTGTTTVDIGLDADSEAETATNSGDLTVNSSSDLDVSIAEDMTYSGDMSANKASQVDLSVAGALTGKVTATEATSGVLAFDSEENSSFDLVAGKASTLNVSSADSGNVTLDTNSDLSGVQSLTVNAATDSHITVDALAALNTATLSGSGQVTLGDMGATDLGYDVSVTASDLADGVSLGTIDTGTDGSITVDVSEVIGNFDVDAMAASGDAGSITVDADGLTGDLGFSGDITANTVSIDAAGTLGTPTYGNIKVGETLTLVGSETQANDFSGGGTITATGESLEANITGGIAADDFDIDASGSTTSITVSGDLGLGDNSGDIDASSATEAVEVDISGLSNYDAAAITGSSKADTITGGSDGDAITGSDGADIIDLGLDTVKDNVIYGATTLVDMSNEGGDEITNFDTGSDVITFDQKVLAASNGSSAASEVLSVTAGANITGSVSGLNDEGILLVTDDFNQVNVTNAAAVSTALSAMVVDSGMEIVFALDDGTDTYLWLFDGDAGANSDGTVEADELELIGTLKGVGDVTDLGDSNFDIS